MARAVAIVNPAARAGRALALWSEVERVLRCRFAALEVVRTAGPGDASALAAEAVRAGAEVVLAAGGDGTVHEVVNGLLTAGAGAALGVVPIGTGNDYARTLGLPVQPQAAARALVDARPDRVDAGRVQTRDGDRFFANVAGVGFDAEVAARVAGAGKRIGGALPYLAGILRTLLTYRNAALRIAVDGEVRERTALLVSVGVGSYCAGGMHMLPGADPRDGLLDLCIAGDLRRLEVLAVLPRAFRGTHVSHPKVEQARGRTVRVEGPPTLHVYADGEVLGHVPATFSCLPGALTVLVPR